MAQFPVKNEIYYSMTIFLLFRNQTSHVNLRIQKNGNEVSNVVYGREYVLRADVTHPDGKDRFFVKKIENLKGIVLLKLIRP